jgi:hypothetical protein
MDPVVSQTTLNHRLQAVTPSGSAAQEATPLYSATLLDHPLPARAAIIAKNVLGE